MLPKLPVAEHLTSKPMTQQSSRSKTPALLMDWLCL